jgi:two-component system response regulator HydG
MVLASYEAEQHLLHFGRSDSAVCWTICGLMSGYFSRTTGKEVYVLEDRCLGEGHAACHLLGRTREEWGDERAEELAFFDSGRLKECLDVSLSRVTETLKAPRRSSEHTARQWCAWWARRGGAAGDRRQKHKDAARWWTWHDAWPRSMPQCSSLVRAVREGESRALVHDESTRAAGPFVAVNCGAITETLLESELFGHKRGAFTGAASDRPGLFEAANHGTLLLDEVGEISSGMQVKLLRVLQEREIRRVGENKSRPVDVRMLATTNRHLAHGVADGAFRQDLYYRLKVVELHVPPLRDRRDDILPLARVCWRMQLLEWDARSLALLQVR